MKLKTLKDLKIGIYCGQCGREDEVSLEPLKKEAIKWVKWLSDVGRETSAGDFTMFFNITEEDLK